MAVDKKPRKPIFPTETCPKCTKPLVKGGAYEMHVRACGNGKRRRTNYREIFFAYNGPGPYSCFFCQESVTMLEVIVHHIDEDHTNDAIDNLSPAHGGCHAGHHFSDLWARNRKTMSEHPTRGHRTPHSQETKDILRKKALKRSEAKRGPN